MLLSITLQHYTCIIKKEMRKHKKHIINAIQRYLTLHGLPCSTIELIYPQSNNHKYRFW